METVDRCPVSRINFLYLITASSVGYDISVTHPYFIDQNKSEKYKKKTLPFLFTAKLDRLFEFSHLTARQSYSAVPGPSIFFYICLNFSGLTIDITYTQTETYWSILIIRLHLVY